MLLMSGFMISSGFIVSLLVNQIWSSSSQIHSNFALHLYGVVSGGRGWEAALTDHPGLNTQQIMMVSLKMFFEKPSLFFWYYLGELYEFVRLFVRYEMGLSRVLFLVGVFWLLLARKQVTSQLLLYSVCGIWLSAPFLMDDAGKRVFAVAYPVFGLLMGLATTALVKIVVSGPKAIAELADCAMMPRVEPEQDRLWLVVSGFACIVGFCSVPLIAGTQWRVPASNLVNATCPPTAIFIEENGLNSVRLEVLPDNQPVQRYPHEIQVSQFTQTIPNDRGDGSGGQVYALLHKETEPFALVMIYDVSNQKRRYVVDRNKTHISKGGSRRVLCIEKEGHPLHRSSR